ncbi:uncharacterized protein [Drosophila kikkawai]|uniref:Uncharacterized protein n=1 Tax=Drosophila kikkawai TaxID=30033 RepID=A0A6P4IN95_DROKI|nr:uncharacterized protein LOC108076555 [Drosophila kikkawai]
MGDSHKWMRQLLLVGLIVLLNCNGNPLARRLRLRPLNAIEIRHLENSLPAGRSVSSGFAGLTGFALGLGKALTGVFIYDVITANITEAEESSVSTSGSSLREICLNTGNSSSDITCIVYYTNN